MTAITDGSASTEELEKEIEDLKSRLAKAESHLAASNTNSTTPPISNLTISTPPTSAPPLPSQTHFLLLLADSALPLGSFAFSSGLESYQAHTPRAGISFSTFLTSSISSYASTTLPFVLAAHRNPETLIDLDDQLDAAIICTVGRRASVAQGRALLSIWEKSFKPGMASGPDGASILKTFAEALRRSSSSASAGGGSVDVDIGEEEIAVASAHLGPLFGAVCAVLELSLEQTAYVFMLSHVKALISAAVRASMFGPYQAQKILAGENVQKLLDVVIEREWNTAVEDAGQTVPVMDLWMGRHEVLYSRIFNS